MIQRMTEQQLKKTAIQATAVSMIIERLLGTFEAYSKLTHGRLRSLRIASGRSASDVTCERQHMQPERVEASDMASELKDSLLQYPRHWIDRELPEEMDFDREQITEEVAGMVEEIVNGIWQSTRTD